MRLQKWFVRTLVFLLLSCMLGAFGLYQRWTDPTVVRAQLIETVEARVPGADVTLEAARLRILGGILMTDLRLTRRDDPSRLDFAYIPSGVVYHDKEQLLQGVIAFRKLDLNRPRLHIIRREDGTWNIQGLTGSDDLGEPLPTIVIREGTLVFEDRYAQSKLPPLKLVGVDLTIINDPISTLVIEGKGKSATLGQLELRATVERGSNQIFLSLLCKEMNINSMLVRHLVSSCGVKNYLDLEFEGQADLNLNLKFQPGAEQPLDYDLQCQIKNGNCRHPHLPLPCEKLRAEARCRNGKLQVKTLTAVSGSTELEGHGATDLACWEDDFDLTVFLRHLPISSDLCSRLPKDIQDLQQTFDPRGPMTVKLDFIRQSGQWIKKSCVLEPEKMKVQFVDFRYPINHLRGSLILDLLKEQVDISLNSFSETEAITLNGTWKGSGPESEVDLRLLAYSVPLDEKLLGALPQKLQPLARSFHPRGRCDVEARISRPASSDKFCNEFHIQFDESAIQWDFFPYLLEQVSGKLSIYPGYWTFEDFQGVHRDGAVFVRGRSIPMENKEDEEDNSRVIVEIAGRNIAIDEDLRKALDPFSTLARAWDAMAPAGRLNFLTKIDQIPGRPQDLDIALDVHGCSIEPQFYRYPLRDLSGQFRYTTNRLAFANIKARHEASKVSIEKGTVDISPGGGFYADMHNVQGNPIFPNDGFVSALPQHLQEVFKLIDLTKPIGLQTRVIVSQSELAGSLPDVYWDGLLQVRNNKVSMGVDLDNVTGSLACVGRHDGQKLLGLQGNVLLSTAKLFGQPFRNMHARFQVRKNAPDVLIIGLKAPLFKGDISGQGRVEFNSTMRYEMNLTASQIDLEEFGRHNLGKKTELTGVASARLHLQGQGNDQSSLDGNGTIDVPRGRLYNLPFLLDLLKFLGLRWPDRTAFEEMHASYSIHGSRLGINRLDLWGNAISLTGKGEVNLDGTDLNLDFYPSWARVEQLLPPALRNVSPAISKNLLKIEVRGKIGLGTDDLKFHKRPIPILVDPIMQLREQVTRLRKQ